ncbi:FGGY-family carbohydrate kinase [Fictibacillus terranigra]|uniref:FGGY family carbohydrate kinase n=1 Tax=Fictibacillus terranigra TaxID=3058424 RepID=A0ABT8E516_9BACL|nr:FGGY family carbohydrate kinase [Fictibacillus sp. CENA-BCM004]MDN4073004.1 FGGY family carbohydrate kinase [Fictibacillus sp. CENA-BCM004]
MIIAIDIGTTNLKVGLYGEDGSMVTSLISPMKPFLHKDQFTYFDPEVLWKKTADQILEVVRQAGDTTVYAIGITSMAESGLLVNRKTGKPCSYIIPWFESCSLQQANFIQDNIDPKEHFYKTGLHLSYKFGMSKLLWLREREPEIIDEHVVWMSVSSYIAYCLTGKIAEERTLAARTFAYRMDKQEWDNPFLRNFGLRSELFPQVTHCLEPVGSVTTEVSNLGIHQNINVYLAGHDHICASLAAGVAASGKVYNSMGTAETLVGTFEQRRLQPLDYDSKLSFGLHPIDRLYFWMGGHSASGGSVEWMRQILGEGKLTYEEVNSLLKKAPNDPTGIIYFPYLSGSGAPYPNPDMTAAFIGLMRKHNKSDLLKAVLEGNAYQMEMIREAAEIATETLVNEMVVIGGGVHNSHWIQVKADISGIGLILPEIPEAAMRGAALVAATGEGIYSSLEDAVSQARTDLKRTIQPNDTQHLIYGALYENKYKPLRRMLENG